MITLHGDLLIIPEKGDGLLVEIKANNQVIEDKKLERKKKRDKEKKKTNPKIKEKEIKKKKILKVENYKLMDLISQQNLLLKIRKINIGKKR